MALGLVGAAIGLWLTTWFVRIIKGNVTTSAVCTPDGAATSRLKLAIGGNADRVSRLDPVSAI